MLRIGLLWSGSTPFGTSSGPEEIRSALRELGYVDDQNVAFEPRYAEGRYDRLPERAANLVDLEVDVILAAGDSAAVRAARNATRKIPIVIRRVGPAWNPSNPGVDTIVRGSRPADLPVEQPLRFELVLNLNSAKALGVAPGEWVLARADRVVR